MKIKRVVCLALLSISITVHAGPSVPPKKADADKWLDDFRAAQSKTNDALFINDEEKRLTHAQGLVKLRDRAEKLFSDESYGVCTSAIDAVLNYWRSETSLMNSSSNPHIELSGVVRWAWEGGRDYASCRELIDDIK
jgi:hypothetical protein